MAKARNDSEPGIQHGFGFTPVASAEERTQRVGAVFASVASHYDVMNDAMSLGIHRLWKADFVASLGLNPGDRVLDLAGGTGDIAFRMLAKKALVTVCDINPAMLQVGRARAMDKGLHGQINWVEGNAEALPFADKSFDIVTIAFGLRNVTKLQQALGEVRRVLKVGGRFFCLEFSHIAVPMLQKLYDRYSFSLLPWLGEKIAQDRAAYQYLAESIRTFPDQAALEKRMGEAGFAAVRHRNLSLGIAAVHQGLRA